MAKPWLSLAWFLFCLNLDTVTRSWPTICKPTYHGMKKSSLGKAEPFAINDLTVNPRTNLAVRFFAEKYLIN